LAKHDLAPLITGVKLQSKDASGQYVDGVAGLAYLSAACLIQGTRDMGTSVSADAGGYYNGVHTLTHELAHKYAHRSYITLRVFSNRMLTLLVLSVLEHPMMVKPQPRVVYGRKGKL